MFGLFRVAASPSMVDQQISPIGMKFSVGFADLERCSRLERLATTTRMLAHCVAMACVCCTTIAAFAVETKRSYGSPRIAPTFDHDRIYPDGQVFPFGIYSVSGVSKANPQLTNMQRVAQGGFTLVGPYYDVDWRDFRPIYAAANAGLKFTFQLRPPAALANVSVDARPAAIARLTDAQIAANIREQVLAVLGDPIASSTVARWSLNPEELRYWKQEEMRYLNVVSNTIRAVEAERGATHRPSWMYEPNHRPADGLTKTGVYQDIVCKGVYLTKLPRGPNRSAQAMWSYTQIISAAKRLKTLPQAVLQLSEDFADPRTATNPAEIRRVLRHDAYLGLVMGIKSFNVWSMTETRPKLTTHNEQFQAYGSVAQDLTGALDLQQPFLFGKVRDDLQIEIMKGAKVFDYTDRFGERFKFDTLHSLNTMVGADRYLFLVNSTEQPMDLSITGLPSSFLLDDLFAGTTTAITRPVLKHRLDVLGVSALRFRPYSATIVAMVPEPSAAVFGALAGFWALNLAYLRKRQIARHVDSKKQIARTANQSPRGAI
jgi:hypothetical protein